MLVSQLQQINNRLNIATQLHNELSSLFAFLGLDGFSMLHKYREITERHTQTRLKNYIVSAHGEALIDNHEPNSNILIPLLKGKKRFELQAGEQREIIKEAWNVYREWEKSTLEEYENIACELFDACSVSAYNFISPIITDVSEELQKINDIMVGYELIDWDMPQIKAEQDTLKERYVYLISQIYPKVKPHHYNSLV